MKNIVILVTLSMLLSACFRAHDPIAREESDHRSWAQKQSEWPEGMLKSEGLKKDEKFFFNEDLQRYADGSSTAYSAYGRAKHTLRCTLRSPEINRRTVREVVPAKLEPKAQEAALPATPNRRVVRVIRTKSEAKPETVSIQKVEPAPEVTPPQVEEENQSEVQVPTRFGPVSILPPEEIKPAIDCKLQPDGECLWLK